MSEEDYMAFESIAFADEHTEDEEYMAQQLRPFGAEGDFLFEFPQVYAEDSSSIYPTLTDGNDRTGDKD
jgi:hypothetical protein